MDKIRLGFKKLDERATLPSYAHERDAGMDLYAIEDVMLKFGECTLVHTGVAAEIPDGYELQVRPRSGLALKGVTVWNAPGTIDSKYRGEIGVPLIYMTGHLNVMQSPGSFVPSVASPGYKICKGDRIAQLVLAPVSFAEPVWVDELSDTDRGTGGFGSTGV